jgi:predicted phosphodiesterase
MKRVAAIYDIHGNLPALEAVLAEVHRTEVDHVVVGGDIVPGPMVREVMARLLALEVPARFILGNCEAAMLEEWTGRVPEMVPEAFRPRFHWAAEQLLPEHKPILASWPKTVRMDIAGLGEVLFCHGTPRDEDEIFTRLTPEDGLRPAFADVSAQLVVCGHTHMQFDRTVAGIRVVNAGSVGMPFGEPGAYWLLLGPGVQFRRTPYDLAEAARRIRATKYPDAEDYAANYVLHPPSEEKMLQLYSRVEVR